MLKIDWDADRATAVPRHLGSGPRSRFGRATYAVGRRVASWSELTGVIRSTGLAALLFVVIAIATFPYVAGTRVVDAAVVVLAGLTIVATICLRLPTWSLSLVFAHAAVAAVVTLETAYVALSGGLEGPYGAGFVPLLVAVALFAPRRMVAASYALVVSAVLVLALRDAHPTTRELAAATTQAATTLVTSWAVALLAGRQRRSLRRVEKRLCRQQSRSRTFQSEALLDPLTGVGNRRAFERDLARADGQPSGITVVVIDADELKTVNDLHGHRGGDAFLRAIANTVHASLRAGDRVYRIGGDEFAVIAVGREESAILRRLGPRLTMEVPEIGRASAAVGVASTSDGRNAREALLLADRRMYERKVGSGSWGAGAL